VAAVDPPNKNACSRRRETNMSEHNDRSAPRLSVKHFGYAGLALSLAAALLFSFQQDARVDEQVHFEQIRLFSAGTFTLDPRLTNIPGYHVVMAGLGHLWGNTSLPVVRSLNAAFGAILVIVFALNLRAIHGSASFRRVIQFAFLPILFPFFFLAYTEVLSTLLILLALLATLRQRYFLAILACGLSTLVRQPNIVWLLLLPLIANLQQYDRWPGIDDLKSIAARFWPAAFVLIAFAAFVVWNHGVALGDAAGHPGQLVPRVGNIYFLLLVYSLVFAPLVLGRMRQSVRYVRHNQIAVLALLAAFLLYLVAFENTHPYNTAGRNYYLRNWLLITLSSSATLKVAFFIPMAIALMDLIAAPGFRRQRAAILLVTALSLVPSWLIEQRYYIIPFALLMLFRDDEAPWLENVNGLYAMGVSAWLLNGIRELRLFL
jgi:alpha-1,2-glucosyltransferase